MADMLMAGDDRRMQVRAYKFWSSLLHGQDVPLVADLPLDALPDFGPWSILIDLRGPHPLIRFLGEQLRIEAGLAVRVDSLAQVPPRSLISRLTDRCAELVTCQSALGFEAEFLSHQGQETLYRGLLLPFSSDGIQVDYAYGVISWKTRAEPILRQVRPGGAQCRAVAGKARAVLVAQCLASRLDQRGPQAQLSPFYKALASFVILGVEKPWGEGHILTA